MASGGAAIYLYQASVMALRPDAIHRRCYQQEECARVGHTAILPETAHCNLAGALCAQSRFIECHVCVSLLLHRRDRCDAALKWQGSEHVLPCSAFMAFKYRRIPLPPAILGSRPTLRPAAIQNKLRIFKIRVTYSLAKIATSCRPWSHHHHLPTTPAYG